MKLEDYIKEIIKRGIEWFDYKKLDHQSWRNYRADALRIAGDETFNNELNHYKTDLLKFITYEAKDFDQVLHARSMIVALETLKERFESIEDPEQRKSNNEPYEAI